MSSWILGVDSGGSGLRVALARADRRGADGGAEPGDGVGSLEPVGRVHTAAPVPTGRDGIDPVEFLDRLIPAARALLTETAKVESVDAVCVGAAGMATLGDGLRDVLPAALERAVGAQQVALAADAVTGYATALGERPGVVVAAGTGLIALGTDLRTWRRSDGWGHLLGDLGGGAWIGQAGLQAALRAHDGRSGGSQALLERVHQLFGPAPDLPGRVYPRTDRPAVLASFAPEVARLAAAGDEVSADILASAAEEITCSAIAALPEVTGAQVALTGGLLKLGEPLLGPLRACLADRLPGTAVSHAQGEPLSGALLIAASLVRGSLRLPADQRLLTIT